MIEYETLMDDLIRELNKACATLREAGKCDDERKCYNIGWCCDAWAACGIRVDLLAGNGKGDNQQ